jgi:hypothetical protein
MIVGCSGQAEAFSEEKIEMLWNIAVANYSACKHNNMKCGVRPNIITTNQLPPMVQGRVDIHNPNVVMIRPFLSREEKEQILIHEFIHVLQLRFHILDEYSPCVAAVWEREAYNVSRRYGISKKHSVLYDGVAAVDRLQRLCFLNIK